MIDGNKQMKKIVYVKPLVFRNQAKNQLVYPTDSLEYSS